MIQLGRDEGVGDGFEVTEVTETIEAWIYCANGFIFIFKEKKENAQNNIVLIQPAKSEVVCVYVHFIIALFTPPQPLPPRPTPSRLSLENSLAPLSLAPLSLSFLLSPSPRTLLNMAPRRSSQLRP